MVVGNAGVGKTALVRNKLDSLPESYMTSKVPFNYYTTSLMLQGFFFFVSSVVYISSLRKQEHHLLAVITFRSAVSSEILIFMYY